MTDAINAARARLAVIGTGQMGGALVRGWAKAGTLPGANVRLFDVRREAARALAAETGAVACEAAEDAVRGADAVLLAVKPYFIADTLRALRDHLPFSALLVSIAAGVPLAKLEGPAPTAETPVIRVMPNTPALVGEGASAYCRGKNATEAHAQFVATLFSAVGRCVEVTEPQIDAVIGVAGSAPAYFYLIVEALTDGGVRAGLPRDVARTLAAQTMLGAAKMVLETGEHPMALKDAVTTPGGTTIAALGVLESAGIRGTLMDAVKAAQERAREMG
jgi:pyrroline-5-carboxylate reductase